MTQDEVYQEALQPSKKWVEAGTGAIGKAYVEVIACDDLPNMVRCEMIVVSFREWKGQLCI